MVSVLVRSGGGRLIIFDQSRSDRHHQQMCEAPDGFPTPPSSASTPPAAMTPPIPPSTSRISTRGHSPRPRKRQRLDVDHQLSSGETTGESTTDSQTDGSTVRIQRIRLKYSEPAEQRASDRLVGKQEIVHEISGLGMDDVERETETSDREMEAGKSAEWQVFEMVEETENWRVIGLNNVGNTCFTNAILQVFSYLTSKNGSLTMLTKTDKRRYCGNTSFGGILILRHR